MFSDVTGKLSSRVEHSKLSTVKSEDYSRSIMLIKIMGVMGIICASYRLCNLT